MTTPTVGLVRVNLGAGRQAYEHPGYISVDKKKSDGIDVVWDLENGLPKRYVSRGFELKSGDWVPMGTVLPGDGWSVERNAAAERVYFGSVIFDRGTVDEFLCKHVLEHLSNDGFMRLMDEMHDALKPNGLLHIYVPNGAHVRAAHSDPTHKMTFTFWTWEYFTHESLAAFPYTDKAWRIDPGYPRINGTPPDDLWEIEVLMRPVK